VASGSEASGWAARMDAAALFGLAMVAVCPAAVQPGH
jgi:hypothetical protein